MKLTQKTLFQCFEKSRPKSPVINSSPSKTIKILFQKIIFPSLCLAIPSCESQIKPSSEQQESHIPQPDFLLPIHTRQLNNPLSTNITPSFNERKFNDDQLFYSTQEFYRICPTIINNRIHSPKIEVLSRT